MRIETIHYDTPNGWSLPGFPDMDSASTLVLVFGSAKAIEDNVPLEELFTAYPRAHILGCSTAGEILGTTISGVSIEMVAATETAACDTCLSQTRNCRHPQSSSYS